MRNGPYGYTVAAILHVGMIAILSIAITYPAVSYVPEPVTEPRQIDIGQQVALPPELTPVEPELEAEPPIGSDIPEPTEPDAIKPSDDPSLIPPIDLDRPEPIETIDEASKGLPGQPTPVTTPADLNSLRGPDSKGIPELFGMPIDGDTLFVVDLSGSMADPYGTTTRWHAVINELINAINSLRAEDSFDIVAYSGSYEGAPYYTRELWNMLQPATPDNKADALRWLDTLIPDGSTPTYEALQYACMHYPTNVENLILVTDGLPNSGSESKILGSAPRLFSRFTDLDFICISISSEGLPFVKRLVDKAGGTYVLVD